MKEHQALVEELQIWLVARHRRVRFSARSTKLFCVLVESRENFCILKLLNILLLRSNFCYTNVKQYFYLILSWLSQFRKGNWCTVLQKSNFKCVFLTIGNLFLLGLVKQNYYYTPSSSWMRRRYDTRYFTELLIFIRVISSVVGSRVGLVVFVAKRSSSASSL